MTKRIVKIFAAISMLWMFSWVGVASAQTISSIDVEGNQRVEVETIESYLTFSRGGRYSSSAANTSLKALFETGLFADVNIYKKGSRVVVVVRENPVIGKVAFEGNKKIKDKQLSEAVRSKPRGVLTQSRVQSDIKMILESYRRLGRFDAEVNAVTIDRGDNRVDLVFEISENKKTRVRGINFVGNERYSDGRLRDVITTSEAGMLNILSTRDVYDPDRLDADLELLRQFYLNAGYADFEVISSIAELDRESNAFYVTITVDEGQRYEFGEISVETTLELDQDLLDDALKVKTGEIYNAEHVDQTLEGLTIAAAQNGYALARVRPRGNKNAENATVDIAFYVEEGPRVYIERINILGNQRTRDYVIRREFDIEEGDAFNQVLLDRAKKRLQRMGIFQGVKVDRVSGSRSDRVILNVHVTEKSTASLSLGGGYSTGNGFIGEVSFTESNLMGRGQQLRATYSMGSKAENYELSFTEPRFMGRRISAGFDLFQKASDFSDSSYYKLTTTGGRLRMGFLVSDRLTFSTNYTLEMRDVEVTDAAKAPNSIVASEGETTISSAAWGLTYSTIDNLNAPTNGLHINVQQKLAGLGGDVSYLRSTAKASYYHPLTGSLIGILTAKGGHIISLDGDGVRQLDAFRLGGETIRGFEPFGITPRDGTSASGGVLGATSYWAASAEVQFPLPGLSKSLGFKGALFADAGSVYGLPELGTLSEGDVVGNDGTIRSSVGASVIWSSPFGPLRFDFAEVLSKEDSDKEQFFRFGIDTKF